MRAFVIVACLLVMAASLRAGDEEPYTPKAGSPERTAICDGMRRYVRYSQGVAKEAKFLFVIDSMRVLGNYAFFEGHPVAPGGGDIKDDNICIDIVLTTLLRRNSDGWWVLVDLTRGDVPSAEEMREIRGTFPAEIPKVLLSPFWRERIR